MAGKRKRLKAVDVKVIQVPHIKGLKVESMYEFAAQYSEVMECFPTVQRERDDLPRSYIANVINTVKPKEFQVWVDPRVNNRHEARAQP